MILSDLVVWIDTRDYPEFADAYIYGGNITDPNTGEIRELTDEELDIINDDYDFVHEQVMKELF